MVRSGCDTRRGQSGQVAQVVERSPEKAGVGGSTPSLATILFNDLRILRLPFLVPISPKTYWILSLKLLRRSTTLLCDSGTNCV